MKAKLQGETALVTGGGRGIGRAICKVFAREGARVAVADIEMDSALRTAEALPTESLALEMDVSSGSSVRSGFEYILNEFGRLDILVNNAGLLILHSFEDCTEEIWNRTLDVNLKGCFLCAQAALSHMKDRRSGAIVNMTSLAGKTGGMVAGPAYGAAKAGVLALTLGLARYSAPFKVRVNGIAPGIIATEMTSNPLHNELAEDVPLGEKGRPEDVANCALFLASGDASHITGEIIDVNGGLLMD